MKACCVCVCVCAFVNPVLAMVPERAQRLLRVDTVISVRVCVRKFGR